MKQYPISRDGWSYLSVLAGLTALAYWFRPGLSIFPGTLFFITLFFFRNPEREVLEDEFTLVSPADGVVMDVERVFEERFFKGESIRIRIYQSLLNVHVNRSPMRGNVVYRAYREGKMLPIMKGPASERNEKNYLGIQNDYARIFITQVTGFLTHRIVCWVKSGDQVERGERFGWIKLGSCTEIFLPPDVEVTVSAGDKVRGGETIIGRVKIDER